MSSGYPDKSWRIERLNKLKLMREDLNSQATLLTDKINALNAEFKLIELLDMLDKGE